MKRIKGISSVLLVALIIISMIGCDTPQAEDLKKEIGEEVEDRKENDDAAVENEEENLDDTEEDLGDTEESVGDTEESVGDTGKVPREHKAALNKAKIYANQMDMSKQGVYDQLVSEYGEGFPEEAAQYAVDNVEADWKENALNKAKIYANQMDMSDSAIFEQLVSEYGEKFTEEEAQYAIDNLD